MLSRLSKPVNPAAMAAIFTLSASARSDSAPGRSISLPPNTSCSIGDAMPMTPMPALTFMHRTPHNNQNCGVDGARNRCTCRVVIMLPPPCGACQPAGFQPVGGTR
ncbi:hypothetical protein D3C83_45710 [compost metagenome]